MNSKKEEIEVIRMYITALLNGFQAKKFLSVLKVQYRARVGLTSSSL